METWFLADRAALRSFYGDKLQESALPAPTASIEAVCKDELFARLEKATRHTKTKGAYGKGAHSFKVLALLDPDLVCKASPWAARFFDALRRMMQ